jgi:hypothetical protein
MVKDLCLWHRTYWLLQPSHAYSVEVQATLGDHLYEIDLDLLMLHLYLSLGHHDQLNESWNPTGEKFLFLTGKPDRPNRIRLLHKFYQAGLLDHCCWSLFVDKHTYHGARSMLPELTKKEFDDFVNLHNRNADGVGVAKAANRTILCHGYPFDRQLYANSCFRVISETSMLDRPVVSEKTWITIANRVPFLMIGEVGNLRYLESRGYRTYQRYLAVPDYDTVSDLEDRMGALVENTRFWWAHIRDGRRYAQQHDIARDVRHNWSLLQRDLQHTVRDCQVLATRLGEPERSVYSLTKFTEQNFWQLPGDLRKKFLDLNGLQCLR